jgi:hypothetical protein
MLGGWVSDDVEARVNGWEHAKEYYQRNTRLLYSQGDRPYDEGWNNYMDWQSKVNDETHTS